MTSNYSIALEKQVETLGGLTNTSHDKSEPRDFRAVDVAAIDSLTRAETFFIGTPIAPLLDAGQASLPDFRLDISDLYVEAGYAYFARPVELPLLPWGDESPLGAICWATWHKSLAGELFRPTPTHPPTSCMIFPCMSPVWKGAPARFPVPMGAVEWPFGLTMAEMWAAAGPNQVLKVREPEAHNGGGDIGPRFKVAMRYWLALMLFLDQRILVARHQMADRATRRRLQPALIFSPLVRVILLREQRQRPVDGMESAAPDWSCRWLVRGHWRQQWYPTLNRHQPKWIAPYVKGPEDKPLKMPKPSIFAVVR